MIQLRDYQSDMVTRVKAGMRQHKWQLLQLATGGGKTFTAGHMIDAARQKGNTCFFIVPRRELLKQTAESYASVGIPFSYVAAGYSYNPYSKVQLCTVGSLAKRLDRVKPPRLAFIDETHYGSNQLGQIIQWLKDHGSYGIGLSATPSRTDGRGLGMWYDSMVEGPTLGELIRRGELSDYRLFGVDAPDMSSIRTVAGEYAKGQLADKMEQDRVLVGSAVSHYRNHAMGRLNVTFCASVKHAEIVAASFRDGGVPAACIHGGQDDGDRARLIKAFARRELLVLTSCQLLTFGFDLSSAAQMDVTVECMSDLQPTQSLAMQLQKYGRALRKKDFPALIFDHAGNAGRHGFPDDDRDWTLEDKEKRKGGNSEPTLPVRQCHECYFCHRPAPECPECGFVYPVQDRVIDEVEGELQELTRERERKAERQSQGMAKTYPELVALAVMKGYRNPHGWAQSVLKGRERKHAAG